eukprot:Pgem_evm1s9104
MCIAGNNTENKPLLSDENNNILCYAQGTLTEKPSHEGKENVFILEETKAKSNFIKHYMKFGIAFCSIIILTAVWIYS